MAVTTSLAAAVPGPHEVASADLVSGSLCLLGALLVVVSEWRHWVAARSLSKIIASTAFVALALQQGATASPYGRAILLALCLSWLGDLLLLFDRDAPFLAGIGAFFLAHLAFAGAFLSRPSDPTWLLAGLGLMTAVAVGTLRWLWRHLAGFFRLAVPLYVLALVLMASLAIGAGSHSPLLPTAALAFAVSDICVARDRFVTAGIANKAWGLPLYYAAQVLFALSVQVASQP